MASVEEVLLNIVEKLPNDKFKKFKDYLQLPGIYGNLAPIPCAHLEGADRMETVKVLVQRYTQDAVEVTRTVLVKVDRNDLAQLLAESSSELQDEERDRLQPPKHQILRFQSTLQKNLKGRFISVQEGMAELMEAENLKDIFTKLFITEGAEIQINEQHEVMLMTRLGAGTENPIDPCDIFQSPNDIPIRTVLTSGVAGIGKTVLVRHYVLDWAEKNKNQDLDLIFPFSFSKLNLEKGKRLTLAELIHRSIFETKAISEKDLNQIFFNMQTSGCSDFRESHYKVLFVLDGLDESRLQLDFKGTDPQPVDFELTESTSVEVLLSALISGDLLPSARVWITSRPAATNHIPRKFINRVTVVRGFSDPQKEEYFKKKFPKEEEAKTVISHIKNSQSLFIMCHIPVFCWITSQVLQDVLKNEKKLDLPTTLTQMYTEFLKYQIEQTKNRCHSLKESIRYIKSLAKLAFERLEDNNLFYEADLKHSGIDLHKASQECGMFTEDFKQKDKSNDEKGRMYRFVHLTLQEYLAALHVVMSLVNNNKNLLDEQKLKLEDLCPLRLRKNLARVHEMAIQKALSSNGQMDLFLRFLLGLSLEENQGRLKCLLRPSKVFPQPDRQDTIELVKRSLKEYTFTERSINLFHCLHELKDDTLVTEIQEYLNHGHISPGRLSTVDWMAIVFILLSSEDTQEVFDLRKYSPSDECLFNLMPVVKASKKSVLSSCNLTDEICPSLASTLRLQTCRLRELDLSDNDLKDSGVKRLCGGLQSPNCLLQKLRLSGCMISDKGCVHLALAIKSNPSHLRELDLSFNSPGKSGVKVLSVLLEDPNYQLQMLNVDDCGEYRLTPGMKKYVCEVTLDENTAQGNLRLSEDGRKVTTLKEKQPHRFNSQRFDCWLQVLGQTGLTGRCYWELRWNGKAYIGVTYGRIIRKGEGADSCLGANSHSWCLVCQWDGTYAVQHENRLEDIQPRSTGSDIVGVYLDFQAGVLSFYEVSSDMVVHLHTYKSTFTEPLYPAVGFGFSYGRKPFGSSVSFCNLKDVVFFSYC